MIKNYIAKTIYSLLIKNYPYEKFDEDNKSILKTQIDSYLTNAYVYGIFHEKNRNKAIKIHPECSYSSKLISFLTLETPSLIFIYTQNEERNKGLASTLLSQVYTKGNFTEILPYGFTEKHHKTLQNLVNKLKLPIKVKINTGHKIESS